MGSDDRAWDEAAEGGLSPAESIAVALLCRSVSGDATAQDQRDLLVWCAADIENARAYQRIAHAWRLLGPAGERVQRRERRAAGAARPVLQRRAMFGLCATAAAAGIVAIAAPQSGSSPVSAWLAGYRTRTGGQQEIIGSGGLAVRLNTATSLDFRPDHDGSDRIDLISGEVSVTTAPDRHQSVVLTAGQGQVTARDASFVARRDALARCVTCVHGTVTVARGAASLDLRSGQQVSYVGQGLGPVLDVDADAVAAWQRGLLVFHGMKLRDVVDELNRYRRGRIMLFDRQLAERPVSARIHIDRIDDVLALLAQQYGARLTTLPGGLLVFS